MAEISYTETTVGTNNLVSWPSMAPGDTALPFALGGAKILSVHIHRTDVHNVSSYLWGSNETETPVRGFPITEDMGSNPDLLTTHEFLASYNWVYPVVKGTSGTVTTLVLIQG